MEETFCEITDYARMLKAIETGAEAFYCLLLFSVDVPLTILSMIHDPWMHCSLLHLIEMSITLRQFAYTALHFKM